MEYKQERYILNSICEFKNREAETEFMEYDKTVSINVVRFLMLFMGFVFVLFAFPDYNNYGRGQLFYISLGLRAITLFAVVIVFLVIGSIKRYRHALLMVTLVELITFCMYLLNLYFLKINNPAPMMLLLFAVFAIPNVWKNSIIASCIMLFGYFSFSVVFGQSNEVPPLNLRGIYLRICPKITFTS